MHIFRTPFRKNAPGGLLLRDPIQEVTASIKMQQDNFRLLFAANFIEIALNYTNQRYELYNRQFPWG